MRRGTAGYGSLKHPQRGGTHTHARMYSFVIYVCLIEESMMVIVLGNFVKVTLKKMTALNLVLRKFKAG